MQQVQTRQLNSNTDSVQYVWQTDEEAFVDALMGMARNHQMNRWKKIKIGTLSLLSAMSLARLFGR